MAPLNKQFIAKDSAGNVKKLDLDNVLSAYVTTEAVQEIVNDAIPEALAEASLEFGSARREPIYMASPYETGIVRLATYTYGAEEPLYVTEWTVDHRNLVRSDDAFTFRIRGTDAPFGVMTNKRCFLVLDLAGIEGLAFSKEYEESECRRTGQQAGCPIILDWADIVLGEGGRREFEFRDENLRDGWAVFGAISLSNRIGYTGNVHRYDFTLEFTLCGPDAWLRFREWNLVLKTTSNKNAETESSVDLSSLAYPRLDSVKIEGTNDLIPHLNASVQTDFSFKSPSALTFRYGRGISMSLADSDALSASVDEKVVSIGLDFVEAAGEGIVIDQQGRMSVPQFQGGDGTSAGTAGTVPAPSAEDGQILTSDGWKTMDFLQIARGLRTFIGATETESGWEGLVPAPGTEDRNSFLRGDGTWVKAVSSIDGGFRCDWRDAPKQMEFGVGVCSAAGAWKGVPYKVKAKIRPDESFEYTFPIEGLEPADVWGVSLCHPYSIAVPKTPEERTAEWTADKAFWKEDKNRKYSVHFEDGTAIEAWLEIETAEERIEIPADDPDTEPHYQVVATQYAVLHCVAYGPEALMPWLATVKTSSGESTVRGERAAGLEFSAGSGESIQLCTLPTPSTILYDDSDSIEPDIQYEWASLAAENRTFLNLHLEARRAGNEIIAKGIAVDVSEWPLEAAGAELVIDYGYGALDVSFDCLTSWLNSRLENAAVKPAESGSINVSVFEGATESESCEAGLVPPASPENRNQFLAGDGSWRSLSVSEFSGAGVEGDGTAGSVPAPRQNESNKFLKGDGSWAEPVQNFNAVERVETAMSPVAADRLLVQDYAPHLETLNGAFAANPEAKIWISEAGTVSALNAPEDTGMVFQYSSASEELAAGQYWNNDPNEGGYVERLAAISVSGAIESAADFANGTVSIEIQGMEENGTVQLSSLKLWSVTLGSNVSGLTFFKKNTVTGEPTSETVDLSFVGATDSSSGRSGLVPQPRKEDVGRVLSGSGDWIYIDGSTVDCNGFSRVEARCISDLSIDPSDTIITAVGKLEGCFYGPGGTERFVDITEPQTVTGSKTFTKNILGVPAVLEGGEINASLASTFIKTVDANTTLSFTGIPEGGSAAFSLAIVNGGSHQVTWPQNIQWVNGAPPALKASGVDVFQFQTWDGGQTWHVSGSVPMYQGATASATGTTGTVPPAASAQRNDFLKGDGSWGREVVVTNTEPDASSNGNVFFLITE